MSYKISLLNYAFDRDNNNTILFNTAEELRQFFNDKISYVMEDVNFICNDLITASVYFDNDQSKPLFELLNYNYAIIEQEGDEPLYFWVMSSKQDSGTNIRLELSIDPWNTYINKVNNAYGLVERAHLSRFIKSGDKYLYNFKKDSPLFEREDLHSLSKIPENLTRLRQVFDGKEDLTDFIYKHIDHWVYYYLSPGEYKFGSQTINLKAIEFAEQSGSYGVQNQSGGFVVLCAPVYKANASGIIYIKPTSGIALPWQNFNIDSFLRENNGVANVFAIKHSPLCPLYLINPGKLEYTINEETGPQTALYITKGLQDNTYGIAEMYTFFKEESPYNCITEVLYQSYGERKAIFESPEKLGNWEFSKDQINATTEPKIENEDYCNYRIFLGGQEYLLPVSKTSTRPVFRYIEILDPDITKAMLIYDPTSCDFGIDDSIMTEATTQDFTGFTITLDLSQWIIQDNLDLYLANNKNALQIFGNEQSSRSMDFNTRQVTQFSSALGSIVGSVSSGDYTRGFSTAIQSTTDLAVNRVNFEYQQKIRQDNYNLTLDNMRASPDTIKKINSSPFLIASVSRIALYIERENCIEFEKNKVIDYLKMFGYSYARSGNMLDFLKNRHYYNYIQGIIDELDVEASEAIKDRIRVIFSNGVRVWRGENFQGVDYSLNNIEEEIFSDNG